MSTKRPDSTRWPEAAEAVCVAVAASLDARSCPGPSALVIGYSGGIDSHVLLLAARRWSKASGADIRAVYIDHGLQSQSAEWGRHCGRVCEALAVDCQCVSVSVDTSSGHSPEQAAREARYGALEAQLSAGEWLLTAHHADDQAETLLLQLLRGAGVDGLASMPVSKPLGAGVQVRPMLAINRSDIKAAAEALNLRWIEDNSNTDIRYDRNYLRRQVLPLLKQRWPATVPALVRSASHTANAADLLFELAAMDIPLDNTVLEISALRALSKERLENALRGWIRHHGHKAPPAVKLKHLVTDLVMAPADSRGQLVFGGAEVRRHGQHVYIGEAGDFEPCAAFDHVWTNRADPLFIPESGHTISRDDVPLSWLADDEPLSIKSRQGGEKLQLNNQQHRQSVKSLLQQQGLPPWERSRLPFVWRGEELLGVIGLGFVAPSSR